MHLYHRLNCFLPYITLIIFTFTLTIGDTKEQFNQLDNSTILNNNTQTDKNNDAVMVVVGVENTDEQTNATDKSSLPKVFLNKIFNTDHNNNNNNEDNEDTYKTLLNNTNKVIIANEIPNLPRFNPKNGDGNNNKQQLLKLSSLPSSIVVANDESGGSGDTNKHMLMPPPSSEQLDNFTTTTTVGSVGHFYEDNCELCPDIRFMKHYFAKNCIAQQLQEECKPKFCPKYFQCPKDKELPKDGCIYEKKKYKFGESVPQRDPCQYCMCANSTNGPMLSCAINECFNSGTVLESNCYRKYIDGQCCPEIVCTPSSQTLSTCTLDGNVYHLGDYFSPEGDPCQNCFCDERWNQSSSPLKTSCTQIDCHFDFDRPENKGCVPVYSEKSCCPLYFHCPDESNKSNQPKCKFGQNFYEIGEKVKVKQHQICLECSCLVPPEITCTHKSCASVPNNCTSVFVEGECCPQFNCNHYHEQEDDSLHKKDSMKDNLEVEHLSVVQSCPPIDDCDEPCKIEMDEDDFGEQSEKIKCARCKCPTNLAKLSDRQFHNDDGDGIFWTLPATKSPCQSNNKQPCSSTTTTTIPTETTQVYPQAESSERLSWAKSMKLETSKPSVGEVNNKTIIEKNNNNTSTTMIATTTTTTAKPQKTTTTTSSVTKKPKKSTRCPDVACEYPCYIYKVTSADCPQCSCPSKMKSNQTNNQTTKPLVQKLFVTAGNLAIGTTTTTASPPPPNTTTSKTRSNQTTPTST